MMTFDTKVQFLKYRALCEVARHAWKGDLTQSVLDIPKSIIPGKTPTMRCCVYKERAIVGERVRMAMGGDRTAPHVIEVIDIACDECPAGGYEVTESCRGCLAHRCKYACPRGAISFDEHQKATIDKTKCVNCGMCAKVCPYSAIVDRERPCQSACKVKAIGKAEDGSAVIDREKCISCGACVYQCPFGAITDKSFILDVIDMLQKSDGNSAYKVYAVVAPSISSQFANAKLGQVVSAMKALGFFHVVEAALGADMVAYAEGKELFEKGFLTSSCCPAFVDAVDKQFPDMAQYVSTNPSPMTAVAKLVKQTSPGAKVVFIGPCTAKKMEQMKDAVRPYIDSVITFEELQALFDSRDLDLTALKEDVLDNASYFGRIFARSGGLSDAVRQALSEQGLDKSFTLDAEQCDGIVECRAALLKKRAGKLSANFIEGMACVGGCIGGAGCLTHGPKNRDEVDAYGREAYEKSISDALRGCGGQGL